MLFFKTRQPTLMSKKYSTMVLSGTLTMMEVSLVMMSDSLIAGIFLGENAVAGITLVLPLHNLATFFGSLFSLGVPILYSTEMGKFNKQQADRTFGFGLLMSLVVGVALFLLIGLFGESYLSSTSPPKEVLSLALDYLFWIRASSLFVPIQMLLCIMIYCDGDEAVSNIANTVEGVGNVLGSIVLSRFMGIRGIALSTFLFIVISTLVTLTHFLKERNSLRWNFYFSLDMFKEVVQFSIIDSSAYLFLAAITALLNAFISAQFGARYLILVSAIALCREFHMLFDGIGEGVTPIFSVYLGENNHTGLRNIYALANRTAIAEGILVTLALMIFAPFAPGILHVAQPELARWIVVSICLTALGSTFTSLLFLITSYYLVIEQIPLGLVVSGMRDVILSAALAVILGKIWGLYGMLIGLAAAPAIAYVLLLVYITLRYGKKDFPLLLSRLPGGEDSYIFNLSTEPEEIIHVRDQVSDLLQEHGVDSLTHGRITLLIEELYTLIREQNDNKSILCECSILFHPDSIQVISKDEGVLFDVTEDDKSISSLAAFTISSYLDKMKYGHRHLTTMSFNRTSFKIHLESAESRRN